MNRLFTALFLVALSFTASAEVHLRAYGAASTVNFKLYNADGTLDVDEVDGGTEVSLTCDEGTPATATNDFVDEGSSYSIALTATELQCARLVIDIAATTLEVVTVETYGHASAQHTTLGWLTGDAYARIGAPVGASLSADLQVIDQNIDDVETDTADMQPKLGTFPDLGSGATLAGNLEDMRDDGTETYSRTTDSLQAIRDRGDAAWTTGGACPDDIVCTTVATAPTTTSITATAAPNDDTQLDGWAVLFTDNGDADSYCLRSISSVSTGTITYSSACPFTVAAGDTIAFLPAFLDQGVNVMAIEGTDATTYLESRTLASAAYATASAVTTLDGKVDTVDSVADAIQVKTDQLTFGVTNELNVNVESMNANSVCGTGDPGTPWTGCP